MTPGELAGAVNTLASEIWVAARTAAERELSGERERLAAEQAELRDSRVGSAGRRGTTRATEE